MRARLAPTPAACLLAAILLTACGDSTDPAGEPEAASPAVPKLEPIATFGCAECEGPELLAEPGVTVGASGRVYVFDTVEPHVRVLESDGTLAITAGNDGEGPGEIRMRFIIGVLEDGDGGFWVQEATFLHHYANDGTSIETAPYEGRLPMGSTYDHARQEFYMVGRPLPIHGSENAPRLALLRYRPGTESAEDVAPWEEVVGADGETDELARWSTVAIAPDGRLAIADAWNYRIRVLGRDGALVDTFARSDLPHPMKPEAQLEREREFNDRMGGPVPDPRSPQLGPWAAYDGTGRLWLHALRGDGLLDVFSPDGSYLGEVELDGRLPPSFPTLSAAGDRLAAVLYDQDHLPTVHVFRIVDR